MKIAFLDPINWDYDVETPLRRPLGGSQSALCYLATALARRGHEVSLVNRIARPGEYGGVRCVGWQIGANTAFLNRLDAVVVLNSAAGQRLRDAGVRVPLVLWTQHAHDQRAIQGLRQPAERDAWTAFAFLSRWQAENYAGRFGILAGRSRVLHNAIAPAFEAQPIKPPWYQTGEPPTLAYASTPFRGLDVLLGAFPSIRARVRGVRLRVFSSMQLYGLGAEKDEFRPLYELCAALDGADYVGAVGQARLAAELSDAAALAYPCTYPETFCIAAAEALAAGAMLLTTRLGALPELYGKDARMIEPMREKPHLAADFADLVVAALEEAARDPASAAAARQARIANCRARFSWDTRAREWEEWLPQAASGAVQGQRC